MPKAWLRIPPNSASFMLKHFPVSLLAASTLLAFTVPVHAQTQGAAPKAPQPNTEPKADAPKAPPAEGAPAEPKPPAAGDATDGATGDTAKAPEAQPQPPADADAAPPADPNAGAAPEPSPPTTAPPSTGLAPTEGLGVSAWPEPEADSQALQEQGDERPDEAADTQSDDRVFAEDWWAHTRPMLEIGGYFRVRAELFHKFSLDRFNAPGDALWPRPADDYYVDGVNRGAADYGPQLCTADETGRGSDDNPGRATQGCRNNTQAGANMRFRINPQLVVSDNLRVLSQIDMLDNLVMGSTPEGYYNTIGANGYEVGARGGYTPTSLDDDTQVPPSSGRNSTQDSIVVKRAWGEYLTPVGQLRFGRMPSHWGLGIFQNSGDGYDDDYQSTVDRLAFVTGIKSLDLYMAGAWDFAATGPTSASFSAPGQQPYDLGQLDDVDQYVVAFFRKRSPALERLDLAKGNVVLNGGLYLMWQHQVLANDFAGPCAQNPDGANALDCPPGENLGYSRRGASVFTPDLWLQLKYKKFRFETEAVTVRGSVESFGTSPGSDSSGADDTWSMRQWGVASELEQKLVEDKLRLKFGFGYASGDEDIEGLTESGLDQPAQLADRKVETFRFHPGYRVDLILHRHLLTRVQGTYYFRPSVDYDFIRDTRGQKLGGGVAAIWTRASRFMQSPGHERDLGIELNAQLYFQSKDGSLNDDPNEMGGFYSMLQYGVLFPMSGLSYQAQEADNIQESINAVPDLSSAQTLRLFLGILY